MSQSKIYVGNLPYSATQEGLQAFLSQFGEVVDVKLIKDFETGRAKGFGFVTFASDADADAALAANGKEFEGRQLKVSIAKDKPPRTGGGRSDDRRR